jgi:hypothetical protein
MKGFDQKINILSSQLQKTAFIARSLLSHSYLEQRGTLLLRLAVLSWLQRSPATIRAKLRQGHLLLFLATRLVGFSAHPCRWFNQESYS